MPCRQGVFGGIGNTGGDFFPKPELTGAAGSAWQVYVGSVTLFTELYQ
jgi:hypothetical protein